MSGERDFDGWVCGRLADWPTPQILDFEQWLRERNAVEFMPAVHEALRRRSDGPERGLFRTSKKPVDELVLRLKRLVRARAALEDGGASVVEIEAHTAEIDRLRAQLAEVVRESAA